MFKLKLMSSKKRVNFVHVMIDKYKTRNTPELPHGSVVVDAFIKYFQEKYESDLKRNKPRKLSYLSTVQTSLSAYKKELRRLDAPEHFLKQLHLARGQTEALIREKKDNVQAKAIDLPAINGDSIIEDCLKLLHNDNIYLRVVAVACLTGRRMAEILHSVTFGPPLDKHYTEERYWSCITGILKQRGEDRVKCREIPLFAPRDDINKALASIRKELPSSNAKDVNVLYGKPIARVMKKYCAEIGNLHQFRKFYVLACQEYFNERNCSLPRLAADYLGHKTMSDTILTYLNFRLVNVGSLDFGRGLAKKKDAIVNNFEKKSHL
jgi:hypothetical protein